MKIAMIGHKDFPSRSGGVETVVCELCRRLSARGEDITVYNRGRIRGRNREIRDGVTCIRIPTPKKQSLNATVYSFLATFHALFCHYDVIHYHAIGPSVPLVIAHLCGKKTVCTVHGLNWRVDKWRGFASYYMKLGERIAARYADAVITLSDEMHRYFLDTYGRETVCIPNAVMPVPDTPDDILGERFGLSKNGYLLYVGRISPEKGILDLLRAYNTLPETLTAEKPLVIAGELPENDFGGEVRTLIGGNPHILCTGFAAGELLCALYANTALYILPSHTEGLALTLLEAMSCGARCLVSDIIENTSVLGRFGASFHAGNTADLAAQIAACLSAGDTDAHRDEEIRYIAEHYGYDRVIDAHTEVYRKVIDR